MWSKQNLSKSPAGKFRLASKLHTGYMFKRIIYLDMEVVTLIISLKSVDNYLTIKYLSSFLKTNATNPVKLSTSGFSQ